MSRTPRALLALLLAPPLLALLPTSGSVAAPDRELDLQAHRGGLGVDGLITDYPDRLRELMSERGLKLPRAYDEPRRTHVEPLPQAHAHNDYEHPRPLHDALSHGFTSMGIASRPPGITDPTPRRRA